MRSFLYSPRIQFTNQSQKGLGLHIWCQKYKNLYIQSDSTNPLKLLGLAISIQRRIQQPFIILWSFTRVLCNMWSRLASSHCQKQMYRPEDDSLARRDFPAIMGELETIHSTEISMNKLNPHVSGDDLWAKKTMGNCLICFCCDRERDSVSTIGKRGRKSGAGCWNLPFYHFKDRSLIKFVHIKKKSRFFFSHFSTIFYSNLMW